LKLYKAVNLSPNMLKLNPKKRKSLIKRKNAFQVMRTTDCKS
jgi:hypothetical protein